VNGVMESMFGPRKEELLTVRELKSSGWYAGVMGDVMLCGRERDIHPSQKFYATIHSEKN
jgi:hypothetical protein